MTVIVMNLVSLGGDISFSHNAYGGTLLSHTHPQRGTAHAPHVFAV